MNCIWIEDLRQGSRDRVLRTRNINQMEGIGLGVKLNLKSLNHLIWPSSTSHFQFKAPSFISTATRACRNNINGSLLPAFRISPLCTLCNSCHFLLFVSIFSCSFLYHTSWEFYYCIVASQGSEPIIHNNTQNLLQVVLVSPQVSSYLFLYCSSFFFHSSSLYHSIYKGNPILDYSSLLGKK